jgi:hypothetical protein
MTAALRSCGRLTLPCDRQQLSLEQGAATSDWTDRNYPYPERWLNSAMPPQTEIAAMFRNALRLSIPLAALLAAGVLSGCAAYPYNYYGYGYGYDYGYPYGTYAYGPAYSYAPGVSVGVGGWWGGRGRWWR